MQYSLKESDHRLVQHPKRPAVRLDPSIDLVQIAARFELGGGAIMNVVRYACLDGVAPQWRRSLLTG